MTAPVALKCPSCASPLKAEDIHLGQGIATCGYCRAVMTLPAAGSNADRQVRHSRTPIPLPRRISLQETMHGIEIRRRWFTPAVIFMVLFCVFWDGFLVVWYGAVFKTGAPLFAKLFPLLHVAAGVGITYATLATFLNVTRIALERGEMKVDHGPLPWAGKVSIRADNLDQLFCKEKISRGKNGMHCSYEVWVALKDGSHKKLVGAGLEREQAIYIEQEMEKALGLKDRYVSGEMPR